MRTRIVRIGNSQGLRIPKPLIQEMGLEGEVEIVVKGNTLVISRARPPRSDWADAFKAMAAHRDDTLLDGESAPATRWDESEWQW